MTPRTMTWIGATLVVLGIVGHILRFTVPPSELASKGARAVGQVLFKDSRPDNAGGFVYTVTFVFADATKKNYQVQRIVPNKGVWDALKTGGDVRVVYLPDRPEEASIEGAEGLARPHDAAYAYLAWTAIIVGAIMLVLALRQANAQLGSGASAQGSGRSRGG